MRGLVLQTTLEVIRRSRHVVLQRDRIADFAQRFPSSRTVPLWPRELHYWSSDNFKVLTYLFLLDSLNFCFWPPKGKKKWRVWIEDEWRSGYYGLAAALARFFYRFPERATWSFFASISWRQFSSLLQGEGTLQLRTARWRILREVGKVLVRNYGGDPRRFVESAGGDARRLTFLIARKLPSFFDVAEYHGKRVYFLKRAQILVGDIAGAFRNRGIGNLHNLSALTAFPDYRLPQLFASLGFIRYCEDLEKKIRAGRLLTPGGEEEVEIRAATVWAVEYLRQELAKRGKRYLSYQLDWMLWEDAVRARTALPHHRVRTIFY
ncbi:hypothetical protein D6779_12010 [Candidatus Parcubacteria bacterium]|nr:MAG: hypothetical protein D6779_12010 [Candidatus Parcubacteria bacterium]